MVLQILSSVHPSGRLLVNGCRKKDALELVIELVHHKVIKMNMIVAILVLFPQILSSSHH